jgi:type VI secretion system Hcp family effector
MPGQKYLLLMKLQKQGTIKGSSTKRKGELDFSTGVECHSFSFGVATPYDPSHPLAVGKRQHSPITIKREIDEASPLFFQALCSNENFILATLIISNSDAKAKTGSSKKIELTNGSIIKIQPAGILAGKRCESMTLDYQDVRVNGCPVQPGARWWSDDWTS